MQTIHGRIKRETEKAYLMSLEAENTHGTSVLYESWLPKSQVTVSPSGHRDWDRIDLPEWLESKINREARYSGIFIESNTLVEA